MFNDLQDFAQKLADLPVADVEARERALARQAQLTKPPGSLGRLEELAVFLAGWSDNAQPRVDKAKTAIFAGNHGVTAQGVSPYPSEVTVQMVANFRNGGAAINAITASVGADLDVFGLRLEQPTGDIVSGAAMTEAELLEALNIGASAVTADIDILAVGEMGIGNTTVAAALAASCFGGSGADWAGPGTGLDDQGVGKKANVINRALARHSDAMSATDRLRCLGGRELAAIAGAVLAARHRRCPVVVDGYVASAAIAPLFADNNEITTHCVAGHKSAEPAHTKLLGKLGLTPVLDLDMRLGEGTGASLALAVLRAAAATHNSMATFEEAAVANRSSGSGDD
ncbi:MAG: nicotinate-nucleotide--dimethylbenzimidazole phosphoribosyltransferase [Pseudomonadota bacterium]